MKRLVILRQVLNEGGYAAGSTLSSLIFLMFMPGIVLNSNASFVKTSGVLSLQERVNDEAQNYVSMVSAAVRSPDACTANLKAMSLLGSPVQNVEKGTFLPRAFNSNGSLSTVDILKDPTYQDSLVVTERGTLSQMTFKETRPDGSRVYNWKIGLKAKTIEYDRVVDVPVIVSVNSAGLIKGCRMSSVVKGG